MADREILVISEGPTEKKLIQRLFKVFSARPVTVVTFKTNIYRLYDLYEAQGQSYEDLDLISVLRSDSSSPFKTPEREALADSRRYTDIFLIFDFDPHAQGYSASKLLKLMTHFSDSTDAGRLYINYPMVESFRHMALPSKWTTQTEAEFLQRNFAMANLTDYKEVVDKEGFQLSNQLTEDDYVHVIQAHARKASGLIGCSPELIIQQTQLKKLLFDQCDRISQAKSGAVVNTSCFVVPELYPQRVKL